MSSRSRALSIGALAKAASVSTPTIRYYEEIGLLPKAGRSASGQRLYEKADVERLTFIRRCRDFGFSIDQVRLLSSLSISIDSDCAEVRDIARLHLVERSLDGFVEQCDAICAGGPACDCVVFKKIAEP